MRIEVTLWTAIGATAELALLLVVLILLRVLFRVSSELRSIKEASARAFRAAKEDADRSRRVS